MPRSGLASEKPVKHRKVVGGLLGRAQGFRETVSYPKHDGGEWQATVRMADPAWIAEEEAPEPTTIADDAVASIEVAQTPIVVAAVPAAAPVAVEAPAPAPEMVSVTVAPAPAPPLVSGAKTASALAAAAAALVGLFA